MSIDPKSLPDGTAVQFEADSRVLFTAGGGTSYTTGAANVSTPSLCDPIQRRIVRVLVPVPEGTTVEDAEKALADARPWLPLPDGPGKEHVGKRVRCVWGDGSLLEDKIHRTDVDGSCYMLGVPGVWDHTSGHWFVHPDDVPAEPEHDPALIEAVAKALCAASEARTWDDLPRYLREQFENDAKVALNTAREWEASR